MEAIVAVYENWGIGMDGDQPVVLSADRKFFREMTLHKTVIMGRKTMDALPGGKPLPGRVNVVLTHRETEFPGFLTTTQPERFPHATVIGGGSVYAQLLPMCQRVYVTKIHAQPACDTFFPNLDAHPHWQLEKILQTGQEQGILFEICSYIQKR